MEKLMGVADRIAMATGALAPDFKGLKGVDNKIYGLKDFSNSAVLVVVFSCNHCPYVQAYEDRIIQLQDEFKSKGVQFIAINSNDASTYPDDNFENMVKRAKEKNFNFPYLRDESQEVAKAFKASHTPHLFVFDKDRRLRYTGKIDDNWQNPSQVTQTYLRDALSALTEGRAPKEAATFAIGFTIKWKS
jgi:peroxiredoxin